LGVVVEEEMGCCLLGYVSLTSFELGLDLSGYFLVIVKSRNAIQIVDFFCFVAFAGFLPGPDFTSSCSHISAGELIVKPPVE
jgi:hypothetical protein